MLFDKTASYTPDFAAEIDTEEEIIADEYGVSLRTAERIIKDRRDAVIRHQAGILAAVIGLLLRAKNLPAMVHGLALAYGIDDMNGIHSQAEIARKLKCTRALISHYVVGWRDVLEGAGMAAFDCTKFRKHNYTREIYQESAKQPIIQEKKKIYAQTRAIGRHGPLNI